MGERVLAAEGLPGNVVLDVDGCLVAGGRPITGAGDAVRTLVGAGVNVVIATNNSTKTPASLAAALTDLLDVAIAPDRIVTSAMAAAAVLSSEDSPALVIGEEGIHSALESHGISRTVDPEAAGAVVVGLDRQFDYGRLDAAARAVRRGVRFVATNDDPTLVTSGALAPGGGALLAAIERASGQTAQVAGKPHEPMVAAVTGLLRPGATWMVGDRPDTDIALGKRAGWSTVLVLTGVVTERSQVPSALSPNAIIESVAALPGMLSQ